MKSSIDFPDPNLALEEGLIAVGGTLDVPTLYHAYKKGIFPWPQVGYPMLWFSPEKRGILEFEDLHVPRRLQREMSNPRFAQRNLRSAHGSLKVADGERGPIEFTIDQEFEKVIEECQKQPRKGQMGTWITPELKNAYVRFHEAGFAHSVECWKDQQLVGGIYGVFVEGVFSGESMFHKISNASKYALIHLVEHLKSKGMTWMDMQMVTPVTEQMGGKYIPRQKFLEKLKTAQSEWNRKRYHF